VAIYSCWICTGLALCIDSFLLMTVAMPPKIGGGVSPNGYAPEFSGAVFLQISYAPKN